MRRQQATYLGNKYLSRSSTRRNFQNHCLFHLIDEYGYSREIGHKKPWEICTILNRKVTEANAALNENIRHSFKSCVEEER